MQKNLSQTALKTEPYLRAVKIFSACARACEPFTAKRWRLLIGVSGATSDVVRWCRARMLFVG